MLCWAYNLVSTDGHFFYHTDMKPLQRRLSKGWLMVNGKCEIDFLSALPDSETSIFLCEPETWTCSIAKSRLQSVLNATRDVQVLRRRGVIYTRFQCYAHRWHFSTCCVTWATPKKYKHDRSLYGRTRILVTKDRFIWHQTGKLRSITKSFREK